MKSCVISILRILELHYIASTYETTYFFSRFVRKTSTIRLKKAYIVLSFKCFFDCRSYVFRVLHVKSDCMMIS